MSNARLAFSLACAPSVRQARAMRSQLLLSLLVQPVSASAYELTAEQRQVPLEILPADPAAVRIFLIAGEPSNKPGQHEYFAGCALLRFWLEAVPGVAPVLGG